MEKKKHIIIFSHGFGTRKDDRGLLSDIADSFSKTQSILFDYNGVDEIGKILTVRLLSVQAKMLSEVIKKTRVENPEAFIDIIAHSQGCLATALSEPIGIHKIIFITPSLDNNIENTINMFKDRSGTEINLSGISKLARKDGTVTIVPSKFWIERKKIDPIPLYNKLSLQIELTIINAKQDEILGHTNILGLDKKIEIIELDGNHQFFGENRKKLLKIIEKIITKE